MMPTLIDTRVVVDALTNEGLSPARGERAAWLFALDDDSTRHGLAIWNGEWLSLRASAPGPRQSLSAWSLLRANASLADPVRYAVSVAGHRPVELRTDVWLGADDLACAVRQALATMRRTIRGNPGAADRIEDPPAQPALVQDAFAALSWPHRVLVDGRTRLELDVRGTVFAAFACQRGATVRLHVELATQPFAPSVRRALGMALLQANDRLRLVRATVIVGESGEERLVLEVTSDPALLQLAVGALHAACDAVGLESRALRDPPLAAQYLAVVAGTTRHAREGDHVRRGATPAPEPTIQGVDHVAHRIA